MSNWRHIPPYSQQFRFIVDEKKVGMTLIELYEKKFSFRSREHWLDLMKRGDITLNEKIVEPTYVLQRDDKILTVRHDVQEPDVNDVYTVLHESDGVLIVNKPAPIPVHPAGRFFKNSLIHILKEKFPDKKIHTIHRLDLWTTGVLVLATEEKAAKYLHMQIRKNRMKKVYGVLACGDFGSEPFVVDAPIGRVDGVTRGVGRHLGESKPAQTRFVPLVKKGGVTFLKAEPITGRTNQIRVHLRHVGGHVLNDPLYSPEPPKKTDFMGLHCRSMMMEVEYKKPMTFVAPWPEGFLKYLSEDDFIRFL
jgi:RluA family pseudouridine synthase